MSTWDFIVVGAGSAGCVLANRLSADGRYRILLLEAGAVDRSPWLHIPVGYAKTYYDSRVNWMYRTEPVAGLNHRQDYWPRGKVLGGSSAINAMVFIRGQHADYDDWERMGAPGWSWADVLPAFRKLENCEVGDEQLRGRLGPVPVSGIQHATHPMNETVLQACANLGLSRNDDFNGRTQEGVGYYQVNVANGRRISAASAYLKPARSRKNLTIETGAQVLRLLFDKTRCVGLEYVQRGRKHTVGAVKEVILSAGAINSPQILQCSGIGDPALLRSMDIPLVHASPNVGLNLQDHLGINYFYRSHTPTLNDQFSSVVGRMRAGLQYLLTRGGPLSISVNQSGGFFRSNPSRPRPNLQLYFQPTSYLDAPKGTRPVIKLDPFSAYNVGVSQCRPTSRGHIAITSPDCTQPPSIHPNYLSTDHDIKELMEGTRFLRRLVATEPLATVTAEELLPGTQVDTDDQILQDIRNRAGTIFHPTSTCRIHVDANQGVVDPRLRCHGVDGLRIADASVFPSVISGNTNVPVMMLGERAAELICEDHSPDS